MRPQHGIGPVLVVAAAVGLVTRGRERRTALVEAPYGPDPRRPPPPFVLGEGASGLEVSGCEHSLLWLRHEARGRPDEAPEEARAGLSAPSEKMEHEVFSRRRRPAREV